MLKLKSEQIGLLRKEALLTSMNLWVGLTFLRKYNFSELWFFYQSMFSLSIWIERILKLILSYEMLINPSNSEINLKLLWHDLEKLYSRVEILSKKYNCEKYFQKNKEEEIPIVILNHLSKFADKWWRYFHIDSLNWKKNNALDPLLEWNIEINNKIIKRHWSKLETVENQEAIDELSSWMTVLAFSDDGKIINNYKDLYSSHIKDLDLKQKYSMYYAFCLIKALCEIQKEQSWKNPINIDLSEFFIVFRRNYAKRKKYKSWNPNFPYKF